MGNRFFGISTAIVLGACDPVAAGGTGGSTGSSGGSGPQGSSSGTTAPSPPATTDDATSSGEATTFQDTTASTSRSDSGTESSGSTSTGCVECGEGSGSSGDSSSSTSTGDSTSTGAPPVEPPQWPADWSLPLDDLGGYALVTLDDGTIVIGGTQDGLGVVHGIDANGGLAWTHAIDPLQWGDVPSTEIVTGLGVLDSTRLVVLVARGPADYATLDGVFELDVETQTAGWSTLIEGPQQPPLDPSVQYSPGLAKQLVTTPQGEVFVSGRGHFVYLGDFPGTGQDDWTQRLDPATGATMWWHAYYLGSSSFGGFADVAHRSVFNGVTERLLVQANDLNQSSGNCYWRELDPDSGSDTWPTDFTLDTHYEYCWPAVEFSDGSMAAPAGYIIEGPTHIHAAWIDGFAEYTLDTTDFSRVDAMYVDTDDTVYIKGALQAPWPSDGASYGFGRLTLSDPPSSEVLLTWQTAAEYDELRAVDFTAQDEIIVLYRGPTGSVLEQYSTP